MKFSLVQQALAELDCTRCYCGSGKSFCGKCYFSLPKETQRALYKPFLRFVVDRCIAFIDDRTDQSEFLSRDQGVRRQMIPVSVQDKLRVGYAFELIAATNSVTICSLSEMERIVLRALDGEFDQNIRLKRKMPQCTCGRKQDMGKPFGGHDSQCPAAIPF